MPVEASARNARSQQTKALRRCTAAARDVSFVPLRCVLCDLLSRRQVFTVARVDNGAGRGFFTTTRWRTLWAPASAAVLAASGRRLGRPSAAAEAAARRKAAREHACPYCMTKICRACKRAWHEGECLAQEDLEGTPEDTMTLVSATTKACPHCGFRVSHCPSKLPRNNWFATKALRMHTATARNLIVAQCSAIP